MINASRSSSWGREHTFTTRGSRVSCESCTHVYLPIHLSLFITLTPGNISSPPILTTLQYFLGMMTSHDNLSSFSFATCLGLAEPPWLLPCRQRVCSIVVKSFHFVRAYVKEKCNAEHSQPIFSKVIISWHKSSWRILPAIWWGFFYLAEFS